jgi:hypothetical protein
MRLVLADVFRPELVRRSVEKRREIADDPDVGFWGTMGIVTSLEFFQRFLPTLGHRDLLFL